MGLIERMVSVLFGDGRNVVAETAEVFRVNAEADARRGAELRHAALGQFGQEFLVPRRGLFDRFMDALNRVPRPALALGTLALFVTAMVDPVWFAARMAGIALVPDPLWWLLGAIVSFYFGARHQAKGQAFQREIAQTMAATLPEVVRTVEGIEAYQTDPETVPAAATRARMEADARAADSPNAALAEWRGGATM